jgi:outer membrane protein TolC
VIARESVASAVATEAGAAGAYDPTFGVSAGTARSTQPTNSAFAASPTDPLAPDNRSTEMGVTLNQFLSSGGQVSLRASGSRETTDGSLALLTPAYGAQVGAEVRQPLLRGRATDAARLAMSVASSDRRHEEAALRGTLNDVLAAVEEAYWGLVAARDEVGVHEESVALAAQQLDETRARVTSGAAPTTEVAQPRAELERRRADLLGAREQLSRAENRLKLLIFRNDDAAPWGDAIAPVDTGTTDSVQIDRDALVQRALSSRAELDAYAATISRREAESRSAVDSEWPAVDAVAGYDRYGLAGTANPVGGSGALPAGLGGDLGNAFNSLGKGAYDSFRVGLVIGLPIGNRSAHGAAEAARHAELEAQASLARARKGIRVEVLDASASLETAARRVEATGAAREAAEIQLAAERDRYATGRSTIFLVLTHQNDLSRARLDEISARTDYLNARTELARAIGSLAEERGINVNDLGGTR